MTSGDVKFMLLVAANILVVVSYFSIAVLLVVMLIRHKLGMILGKNIFWLITVLLFSRGLDNLLEVLSKWYSLYWAEVVLTWSSGIVAIGTAIILNNRVKQIVELHKDKEKDNMRFELHNLLEKTGNTNLGRLKEMIQKEYKEAS